jgi:hypothetical protein
LPAVCTGRWLRLDFRPGTDGGIRNSPVIRWLDETFRREGGSWSADRAAVHAAALSWSPQKVRPLANGCAREETARYRSGTGTGYSACQPVHVLRAVGSKNATDIAKERLAHVGAEDPPGGSPRPSRMRGSRRNPACAGPGSRL